MYVHPYSKSTHNAYGLTLRDHIAIEAMNGLLAAPMIYNEEHTVALITEGVSFSGGLTGKVATAAYAMADAMLKARSKE